MLSPLRSAPVRVLLVLLAMLVVVTAAAWGLQRRLIYFPDRSPVPPAGQVIAGARDVDLRTADGLRLGAWWVPPREPADRGLAVLLAPGNGGNRLDRAGLAERLSAEGFAVLQLDYRGYGGNPGSPSEDGLAADADAAVAALETLGYPPERTIYFGESLGTGVVAALATRHPPAGMVLRSPFVDLVSVGAAHYPWLPVRALLRDRFPVLDHVRGSRVPTVVVYGDSDAIVPPQQSAEVASAAGSLVDTVRLRGADHNDEAMVGAPVVAAVVRLAEALPPHPAG